MRGFFSAFVALLGVLLLISLLYTQSGRNAATFEAGDVVMVQQLLSRDWVLARNAYSNFAADAMAQQVVSNDSSHACTAPTDFSVEVNNYWNAVYIQLKKYGVDCRAVLSADLQSALEGFSFPQVGDDARAYAILTCIRSIGNVDLNIQHPFVFRKDVQVYSSGIGVCDVNVFDTLGKEANSPIPPYIKQDANRSY
jgi:hypothetical protein